MKNKEKEIFAERLSKAIKNKGYSQKAFAHTIQSTESTVSKYLSSTDNTMPKADNLARIAKTLDVSADWLLGLSDREHTEDQLSLQDVGRLLLQCTSSAALNLNTLKHTVSELCYDDESPEGEYRELEYTAIYFSDWYSIAENGPYGDNFSPLGSRLNNFICQTVKYRELYDKGDITKDIYTQLIQNALQNLGNAPVPPANN